MRSNYKPLGDYIEQVKARNTDGQISELRGVSIEKFFMPSVANIHGVDLSKYKVVTTGEFAFNPMHVGRDKVLPISLHTGKEPVIVSPAYTVFRMSDEKLLPEYLMMWCSRPEFDRNAWFKTDGNVRGGLPWDDFCEITMPVPAIEEQQRILSEYKAITSRIKLIKRLNKSLEDSLQTVFNEILHAKDYEGEWRDVQISSVCDFLSGFPFKSDHFSPSGDYGLITIRNVGDGRFNNVPANRISINGLNFPDHVRIKEGDMLLSLTGNVGRVCIAFGDNLLLNQRVAKLVPHAGYRGFIYCMFRQSIFQNELIAMSSGTAQLNLSPIKLKNLTIKLPPEILRLRFEDKARKLLDYSLSIQKEMAELNKLLELLLAKMTTEGNLV